MKKKIAHWGIASQMALISSVALAQQQERMNILFIAVDDLKPITEAYGNPLAVTPAMDRISKEGVTFMNCYCQQAVSGPTRASIMTGLRPDRTRVWDLQTDFRQVNPSVLTLPQHLKSNGYETAAVGKIYHIESTGYGHDSISWTMPHVQKQADTYALSSNRKIQEGKRSGAVVECAEVADSVYRDGKSTIQALHTLQTLSKGDKPFFLAVGFLKPHLPFVAPKRYWDMYDREKMPIEAFQSRAQYSPEIAYHHSTELKKYSDVPDFDSYGSPDKVLDKEFQKELVHGYHAAMSYTDHQIGMLLDELDRLGLSRNTIVVVWGDHGWHLGDHGLWQKQTNFEQATHTLLLMRVPGVKGNVRPQGLCEFVDLFPTLCDLTNLPTPSFVDGTSMTSMLDNPQKRIKELTLSQYPRGKAMGYTIRTERYRYTEWMDNNFRTNLPYSQAKVIARELYDYQKDPEERVSLVDKTEYGTVLNEMKGLFKQTMQREYERCESYDQTADYQTPIRVNVKKK